MAKVKTDEQRLVHLDLKGAPPKISYYEQLFPLLQKWGATGLLIEYEDMFPYSGDLAVLQARYAYSTEDISSILAMASTYKLDVIPLVQTFGHFEFVLKHEQFHEIREIADYPLSLCPLHEGSIELVKSMLRQVIQLHPDITAFHIGADEVFHIGVCDKCQRFVAEAGGQAWRLFFFHICRVVDFLHETYPHLSVIMWDDMYRQLDADALKESGISRKVEPMIWYYMNSMEGLPSDLFSRYSGIFDNVWYATAFKGATGPCMITTDVGYHVCNHQGWLKLRDMHHRKFSKWKGTAITGWQRYDHYAVLCEILPVAIPSLAICLLILRHGAFTLEVHQMASQDLGFSETLPLNTFSIIGVISACNFPGGKLYNIVQYYIKLCEEYKFVKNDRLKGWMSRYHIKYNYCNPAHLNHFLPQAKQLLASFTQLKKDTEGALAEIFFPDTVEEWVMNNFEKKMSKLEEIISTAERLVGVGAKPKDCRETEDMDSD